MRYNLLAAVAAASLMVAGAASAQMVHYTAKLAGGPGIKGSGDVMAMLDGKTFTYTANYKDMTGPVVAAHFHDAATPGGNGPPIVPASNVGTSPIKGTATLTDAQIADLNAGKVYFNVHTAANPGGEIRGTLSK
jgi:hypothetical protein